MRNRLNLSVSEENKITFIKAGEKIKYCNTKIYHPFPHLDGWLVFGDFEKDGKRYFLAILPALQTS